MPNIARCGGCSSASGGRRHDSLAFALSAAAAVQRALLRRSPLVSNALSLYAVQFAGNLVSFVTMPFLARVLRPDTFGLLVLAKSFALWQSVLLASLLHFCRRSY